MNRSAEELPAAVRALLASDRVTPPTRRALQARLDWRAAAPRALSTRQMQVLRAAAARLIPLGALQADVDLAGRLEAQLAAGPGDGWRYADMPADLQAMRAGLDALDRDATPEGFAELAPEAQDAALEAARTGAATGWPVPSARWFEETLAALAQIAYAHPLVQLEIGYDGMADAQGLVADPTPGG